MSNLEKYGKCVIIPINRSDLAFESSISALFRSYEVVKPDIFFILYSSFNKPILNKIKEIIPEDFKIKCIPLETEGEKEIENISKQCNEVYLIPSSGANITALVMGKMNYPKISFLFAFGPWNGYFYPFVPRLVEKYKVYDSQKEFNEETTLSQVKDKLLKKINCLTKGNQYLKEMYRLSLELNSSFARSSTFDIKVGNDVISDEVFNSKKEALLNHLLRILQARPKIQTTQNIRVELDNVLKLLGIHPIIVFEEEEKKEKELKEVVEGADLVLVDTNLIYYGIHTYEIKSLAIPQCAIHEIEYGWFQRKIESEEVFYNFLYDILKSLSRRTKIIPTITELCDIAVPKIDPTLLENALILTGDKRAYENWKYLPLSKYTQIKYATIDRGRIRDEEHYRAYFELSLAIYLKWLLRDEKVMVCYKGKKDECVEVKKEENKKVL